MEKKRVLVTGGAGYVGSVLVPSLLQKGYQVTVLDNLMYDNGKSVLQNFWDKNFQFVEGDVSDRLLVEKLVGQVDHIIHLAAIVGYPACRKNEQLAHQVNVGGTENIARAAQPHQTVQFASTGSVYGAIDGVCTEESEANPLTIYGINKLDGEKILKQHCTPIIYRFATAFGLAGRLRMDLMVNDFVYQSLHTKHLIVYEKNFRRTFIHVRDIARVFIHGLENYDRMKGQTYNVGHETMNHTKEDIVNKIRARIKFYLHFAEFAKDQDQRDYEVDYSKIRATGFETSVTMDEGLRELIDAFKIVSIPNPYSNI